MSRNEDVFVCHEIKKKGGAARKAPLFGAAGNEVSVHVGGEAPRKGLFKAL